MRTEGCGDWECGKRAGSSRPGRPETRQAPSVSWASCEAADKSLKSAGIPQESRSLVGCWLHPVLGGNLMITLLKRNGIRDDCWLFSSEQGERKAPCVNFDNFWQWMHYLHWVLWPSFLTLLCSLEFWSGFGEEGASWEVLNGICLPYLGVVDATQRLCLFSKRDMGLCTPWCCTVYREGT